MAGASSRVGKPATTSPRPERPCVLPGDERTAVSPELIRASPVPASARTLADGANSSPLIKKRRERLPASALGVIHRTKYAVLITLLRQVCILLSRSACAWLPWPIQRDTAQLRAASGARASGQSRQDAGTSDRSAWFRMPSTPALKLRQPSSVGSAHSNDLGRGSHSWLFSQLNGLYVTATCVRRGCDNHTHCPDGSKKEPTWTKTTTAGSPKAAG